MTGFGSDHGIVPPGPQQQDAPGGIDPALLAQMQQGAPQAAAAPADGTQAPEGGQDPGQPQGEYSDQQPLDLEGCISHAIEAGAQQAAAATIVSAQDYAQLAAGILSLCQAKVALQPQADPAQAHLDGTAITALQRHTDALMRHAAAVHATDSKTAQAAHQAAAQASRPTGSGT